MARVASCVCFVFKNTETVLRMLERIGSMENIPSFIAGEAG
jgi:hypothetical protein